MLLFRMFELSASTSSSHRFRKRAERVRRLFGARVGVFSGDLRRRRQSERRICFRILGTQMFHEIVTHRMLFFVRCERGHLYLPSKENGSNRISGIEQPWTTPKRAQKRRRVERNTTTFTAQNTFGSENLFPVNKKRRKNKNNSCNKGNNINSSHYFLPFERQLVKRLFVLCRFKRCAQPPECGRF